MVDLNTLIKQANELPAFPASAVRLAELVSRGDCDVQEVAELISFDPALTVKLLRIANSAASASEQRIGTAKEAVLRMGIEQVFALVIACGAKPFLQGAVPGYDLKDGALWRHSVAAAVAAEAVAPFCEQEIPPEGFTAALLHDVGKLLMNRFLSAEILGYIHRAEEVEHCGRLEAEALILGVHHGELGGLIAQHWKLPERVILGITYHHNPVPGMDPICEFTYLANHIAKQIEAGLDHKDSVLVPSVEVLRRLGLNLDALDKFYPIAACRYHAVSRRYNSV